MTIKNINHSLTHKYLVFLEERVQSPFFSSDTLLPSFITLKEEIHLICLLTWKNAWETGNCDLVTSAVISL